jgi:hypothetical protein
MEFMGQDPDKIKDDLLAEFGVPRKSPTLSGLLMPLSAHRFRVVPTNNMDSDLYGLFTQQVESAKIDIVKKTLTIRVRATVVAKTMVAAMAVSKSGSCPSIDALDGGGDPVFSLNFNHETLKRHDLDFDYADGACLTHIMVWSFGTMTYSLPKAQP